MSQLDGFQKNWLKMRIKRLGNSVNPFNNKPQKKSKPKKCSIPPPFTPRSSLSKAIVPKKASKPS